MHATHGAAVVQAPAISSATTSPGGFATKAIAAHAPAAAYSRLCALSKARPSRSRQQDRRLAVANRPQTAEQGKQQAEARSRKRCARRESGGGAPQRPYEEPDAQSPPEELRKDRAERREGRIQESEGRRIEVAIERERIIE